MPSLLSRNDGNAKKEKAVSGVQKIKLNLKKAETMQITAVEEHERIRIFIKNCKINYKY